jgi:hypothetical protein
MSTRSFLGPFLHFSRVGAEQWCIFRRPVYCEQGSGEGDPVL